MTDEELIAWVRNGFGNVAADRIEALVKERDTAWNAALDAAAAVIVTEVKRVDEIIATLPEGPPRKRTVPLTLVSLNTGILETEILALKKPQGIASTALKGDDHE